MARGRNATRTSAIHLRPTAALAERVLLPGDPGRALMLAQSLLAEPRMFNHNRGLWGYTGAAGDGKPLTIQATGMGGPSAAIVLSELISLGVRRAIRVGTCGALDASLGLGELLIASEAICMDGTSRALGARERAAADSSLTAALRRSAPSARAGTIMSVDLFYEPDGSRARIRLPAPPSPSPWRWRPPRCSRWAPAAGSRWAASWSSRTSSSQMAPACASTSARCSRQLSGWAPRPWRR